MKLRRKKPDSRTAIEYGLIASLIAVAIVGVLLVVGRAHLGPPTPDKNEAAAASCEPSRYNTYARVYDHGKLKDCVFMVDSDCEIRMLCKPNPIKPKPTSADLLNMLVNEHRYRP
jgi:hypothetical protein